MASIRRRSNSHHRRRWNSDRKIRGNDRAAVVRSIHEELTRRNLVRVTTLAVELGVDGHLFPAEKKVVGEARERRSRAGERVRSFPVRTHLRVGE